MKSTMKVISWLQTGAFVLGILAIINTFIYFIRLRNRKTREQVRSTWKEEGITFTGGCLYTLLGCAFLAAKIIPVVEPKSDFSIWISSEYALLVYLLWALAVFTIFGVILSLCGFPISKKSKKEKNGVKPSGRK